MTDLQQVQPEPETIQTLDSVLEGDELTEETAEVVEQTPEPEVTEEVEEETKGETEEAEAETESEPPTEETKTVPISALTDERRKRQEAEEQLEKLKQPEQTVELPDPVEDPEGYKTAIEEQVKQQVQVDRINDSRKAMLESEEFGVDFEEKERVFLVLQALDPSLKEQMLSHQDPAKFAYDKASEYIQSLIPKVEAKEEVKEDPAVSKAQERKKSAVQVPSLTNAAASGTNNASVEEKLTLDDVLPD